MKDIIKSEFIDFLQNTSIKGVSRVFKSETKLLKGIWCVAVISFISIGLIYAVTLTVEYFKVNLQIKEVESVERKNYR